MITFNLITKKKMIHPTSTAPKDTAEGCLYLIYLVYCVDTCACNITFMFTCACTCRCMVTHAQFNI